MAARSANDPNLRERRSSAARSRSTGASAPPPVAGPPRLQAPPPPVAKTLSRRRGGHTAARVWSTTQSLLAGQVRLTQGSFKHRPRQQRVPGLQPPVHWLVMQAAALAMTVQN